MSTKKTLSVLAASGVLALFAISPVFAEDPIVKEEQENYGNSAQPDVDPGASKGPDAPITTQERMQLGNQPGPDVPEGPDADTKGGESIPEMEKKDYEN